MKTNKERETIAKEVAELKAEEMTELEKVRAEEAIKRLFEVTKKLNRSEEDLTHVRAQYKKFGDMILVLEKEKTQLSKRNVKLQDDVDRLRQCLTDNAIKLLELVRKTL